MSKEIIESVKLGLEDKVCGIETALLYVRDPVEYERLNKDLEGAKAALKKLAEVDTRSPEELEKIAKMIDSSVSVEASVNRWDLLSNREKFLYQVQLYADKLKSAKEQVVKQLDSLEKVTSHLEATSTSDTPFMQPVIDQFKNSLAEVQFSLFAINEQLAVEGAVGELLKDEDFYSKLELLNKYLNNPMNLPSLSEVREAKIKEFKDVH